MSLGRKEVGRNRTSGMNKGDMEKRNKAAKNGTLGQSSELDTEDLSSLVLAPYTVCT